MAKRTAVLLNFHDNSISIANTYDKMKTFYRFRSESLHEGDGNNISQSELFELEEITRNLLKIFIAWYDNSPENSFENLKKNIIDFAIAKVLDNINLGILPQ